MERSGCDCSAQQMHLLKPTFLANQADTSSETPGLSQAGRAGVRMKVIGRRYQVIKVVVLFIAAVALTTALVVATERSSGDSKRSSWHKTSLQAPSAEEPGPKGWV